MADKTITKSSTMTSDYYKQTQIDQTLRLREVLKTLPPFAKDYFRAMEPKSSAKTRINYAYDIRVFFHFLLENNPIYKNYTMDQFRVQDLECIEPVSYTHLDVYKRQMRYGADLKKALLAGLLHDCAKCIPGHTKIKMCEKYNLEISEIERKNPSLLHAKLGAYLAKDKYDIEDEEMCIRDRLWIIT